ncbi:hypothetical protein Q7P37_005374 [Cladosporium fusiforme]
MTLGSQYSSLAPSRGSEPYTDEVELEGGSGSLELIPQADMHVGQGSLLGIWTWTRWFTLIGDIISAIIPVLFIVLGVSVICIDGHPVSKTGEIIQQIIILCPTVFPIVFAATVLEQLNGCQSLFSAIERQILLRCANAIGIGIIFLWALSPLGGQAALRSLVEVPRVARSTADVRYAPIVMANHTKLQSASGAVRGALSYGPIYLAALMATQTDERFPMDIWGNVRIPAIDTLPSTDDDYYAVDHAGSVEYSSLLGLPLRMVQSRANSSFDVVSRYWKVSCFNMYHTEIDGWDRKNGTIGSFAISEGQVWTNNSASGEQTFDFLSLTNNSVEYTAISVINCTLSTRDVISNIRCIDNECRVEGMRPSKIPSDQRLGNNFVAILNTWNMLPKMHILGQQGSIIGSSVTEQWIADPTTNYSREYDFVNISALPLETVSSRLQKVYNTFWQSTFLAPLLFGNLTTGPGAYDNISTGFGNVSLDRAIADIETFDGREYSCRWAFAITLCVIASLLAILAFVSIGLRMRILAPDVLGYASTVLRDNNFASNDGRVRSHMDSIEATRSMRDVHVMLGDVAKDQDTGHIAFATMEAQPQRLKKGRRYD